MIDVETPSTLWLYRQRNALITRLADQSGMTSQQSADMRRDLLAIEKELLEARPKPCTHFSASRQQAQLQYGDAVAQIATAAGDAAGPPAYAFQRLRDAMEHRDDEEKAMSFVQTALFALALQRGRD